MAEADRVRTVLLGTGAFAVPILAALAGIRAVTLVGVVTAPPRPSGRHAELRPTPVADEARDRGIAPVLTPERLRAAESVAEVAALDPALLVLADYGQIVPSALLDLPAFGALNLHPSLLPRHRGAVPIPAAILAGDHETGVSLMRMDAGLDTGPLLAQARVPLDGTETAPALEETLSRVAADLLVRALSGWIDGTLVATTQPDDGATLTRPLRRDDGRVDPALGSDRIERQIRAYQPWPGTWLETTRGRLTLWRAHVVTATSGAPPGSPPQRVPGTLIAYQGGLAFVTADGCLALDEVQLAGGRRMPGGDLLRGHPSIAAASAGTA